jgi:hypothetical protein
VQHNDELDAVEEEFDDESDETDSDEPFSFPAPGESADFVVCRVIERGESYNVITSAPSREAEEMIEAGLWEECLPVHLQKGKDATDDGRTRAKLLAQAKKCHAWGMSVEEIVEHIRERWTSESVRKIVKEAIHAPQSVVEPERKLKPKKNKTRIRLLIHVGVLHAAGWSADQITDFLKSNWSRKSILEAVQKQIRKAQKPLVKIAPAPKPETRKLTPEEKRSIYSAAAKKRWANITPEQRARLSAAQSAGNYRRWAKVKGRTA